MKLDAQFRIPELNEVHSINSLVERYPQFVIIEGKHVRLTLPDEPGFYQWSVSQYAAQSVAKKLEGRFELTEDGPKSLLVRGDDGKLRLEPWTTNDDK